MEVKAALRAVFGIPQDLRAVGFAHGAPLTGGSEVHTTFQRFLQKLRTKS